jgi:S-(hydroxymethyl)glutathione dehydrogenase / alcohol dehydrogenase
VKIRAAVHVAQNGTQSVEDVELDAPKENEVLVRVAASGICRSDLSFVEGKWPIPLPIVLGHEGAGVIEAVGHGVAKSRIGEHVVLTFVPGCAECRACLEGRSNLCVASEEAEGTGALLDGTTRLRRDGKRLYHLALVSSFADHAVVPAKAAVPIDPRVDLRLACLLGCGITTGVCSVTKRAGVRPGEAVAIFGCGGVGLAAVQGARLVSATPIIAVDPLASKREMALRLGATHAIDPDGDAIESIREETGGGVDYAFEAVGNREVAEAAFGCVRTGGTTVLIGQPPIGVRASFPVYDVSQYEHRILGTVFGGAIAAVDIPRIARLVAEGYLDLESLVTHRFRLDDINQALATTGSGQAGRVVVEMGLDSGT